MLDDPRTLPGYRRRIRITAGRHEVTAELEDDFHCMTVRLGHDGGRVTHVEALMHRAPWSTCPGAMAVLRDTLVGQRLSDVTPRLQKQRNCTHLHDLAVVAAAHAQDSGACTYDMAVSDRSDDERILDLRRDGAAVLRWRERGGVIVEPAEIAGTPLLGLRKWIGSLPGNGREAARLLQVAGVISSGRDFPWEHPQAPADMPPTCHTWQPERASLAVRRDAVFDFSAGGRQPLE